MFEAVRLPFGVESHSVGSSCGTIHESAELMVPVAGRDHPEERQKASVHSDNDSLFQTLQQWRAAAWHYRLAKIYQAEHDSPTALAHFQRAQELDDTEHRMYPFIEKFKSMKEAVAKFGRI